MTAHRHPDDRNAFPDDPSVGTLLGIWAHPDDEAYLSAGLMFRAREAGHRVVVATATRGELNAGEVELIHVCPRWSTARHPHTCHFSRAVRSESA